MPELVLTDAKIALGARDLTGQSNSVQLTATRDILVASVFGDTTRRGVAGLKDIAVSIDGLWDSAVDADLFAELGLDNTLFGVSAQDVIGTIGFITRIAEGSYTLGGSHGQLMEANIAMVGGAGENLDRATLMESSAIIVTGAGTNRQLGAVSASQSLVGQLHVLAVSGTSPTLDAIVESDAAADFLSPVTRLTFAQAIAVTSERQTLAGAITDDFFRFNFTVGGTGGPSFTIMALLAIVNN